MAKMVIQGNGKINAFSLYKCFGELWAQETILLKYCMDLGGPFASTAHSLQFVNKPL